MTDTTTIIRHGIWTPWAAVICLNCHGRGEGHYALRPESWAVRDEVLDEAHLDEGLALTVCDKCKVAIAIDAGVAAEHQIVLRLRDAGLDADMDQTGGMCSAARVYLAPDARTTDAGYLLLTDSEAQEAYGAAFDVGYYPVEDPGNGYGLGEVYADGVVDFVRDLKRRYDAGERDFGGEAW